MEVGGGPGLIRGFFNGKSSKNSPKPVLIFWSVVYHVYSVCTHIAKSCWLL